MINVYNITSSAVTFFPVNVPVIGYPKGDEKKVMTTIYDVVKDKFGPKNIH
jgi:hypothetical protein